MQSYWAVTMVDKKLKCRLLLICLFGWSAATECRADVMYTFSYTALSGPVESFTFSLTASTFLTADSSPAFTPFTPTDGTNSWTMTQDLVTLEDPAGLNRACFQFGTPFAGLSSGSPPMFGPCSLAVGGPGVNQAAFELETTGLPSAPGTYAAVDFVGAFDTDAGFELITSEFSPTGMMSLTITNVAVSEA